MTSLDATTAPIEHLDFFHEQPCDYADHNTHLPQGPAAYYIVSRCPECTHSSFSFICAPGWDAADERGIRCLDCGAAPFTRDQCWTIIRRLSGVTS